MSTYKDLAELIFPDVKLTIKDLEKRYPPRDLKEGAFVTRFAPSPTGFLHTGSLFTAMVAKKFASQSGGVYFFRLEDTDQKREIQGTGEDLVKQLKTFNVTADEGYFGNHDEGDYGPYQQSKRADIYKVVIKELMKKGRAYPCFCSKDELNELRMVQQANNVIPGYYGEYAKCRHYSVDEMIKMIKEGKNYVIRFKSKGNHLNHVTVHDMIRGDMELAENDQDIVILKSDGLPTYHFAHLVDDHFMRTNLVTRGEEWISSLPIHIELFETMNWEKPSYAHLPVIMVNDSETGNKRKLSKRKDKEAATSYFLQQGYPIKGFIEYLMTIANSNFESWLEQNINSSLDDFKLSFEKFSLDGALFDLPKLANISKEYLSHLSKEKFTDEFLAWAEEYDKEVYTLVNNDRDYFEKIINIEREQEKPRKDYEKFSAVFDKISFFYSDYYDKKLNDPLPFSEFIDKKVISSFLLDFVSDLQRTLSMDENSWFSAMKEKGKKFNFADDRKEYKKNPEKYIGWYADCISLIRIAVCASTLSPKLYDTLQILQIDEIRRRIDKVIKKLQ